MGLGNIAGIFKKNLFKCYTDYVTADCLKKNFSSLPLQSMNMDSGVISFTPLINYTPDYGTKGIDKLNK